MSNTLKAELLLWQRLSVFAESFSLEAAKAIFAQDTVEGEKLAGLLDYLVSQGRIKTGEQGGNRRYWLPEEQRQVGRVHLSASDTEDTVYSRLVDHYLEMAEQLLEKAFGPERAMWINRLEQEHPNLQLVFKWLARRGDAERGFRLAYLLQELWFEDHHASEARTLFATLLALPAALARTSAHAQYLDLAGAFALSQNDYAKARSLKKEGIAICREMKDNKARFERMIVSARQALTESVQTKAWEEGQAMTLDQATEYALNNNE